MEDQEIKAQEEEIEDTNYPYGFSPDDENNYA